MSEGKPCHRCGEPLDKPGVKEYKWDRNGGAHACIHTLGDPMEKTEKALSAKQRAIRIVEWISAGVCKHEPATPRCSDCMRDGIAAEIASAVAEAVADKESAIQEAEREAREGLVKEIAATQALVHGESVVLNGKLVTNEELYKQPTDYVKEAYEEGFKAGAEAAAKIVQQPRPSGMPYLDQLAAEIRALPSAKEI